MSNINYQVNPKLKHLTEDELKALIRRYYTNDNIETLIEEYKIDTISNELYSLLPTWLYKDVFCPKCHRLLVTGRKPGDTTLLEYNQYCDICGHTQTASSTYHSNQEQVDGDDANKVNYEVNPKLKHLTQDEINELMRRYYNNEKTTALIKEYKINATTSQLCSLFPPEICEDMLCPNCNIHMVTDRQPKTRIGYGSKPYCYKCGHTDSASCKCEACSEKRKAAQQKEKELKLELEERKRELIRKAYALHDCVPIELNNLTFRDRLYIGALLRVALSEDMQYIEALDNIEGELAPTVELKEEILMSLTSKKIIVVHPNSNIEAFVEREGVNFPYRYYLYKVKYHLNVGEHSQKDNILKYLLNPAEISGIDNIMVRSIWKEIGVEECLQYFKYQMEKVNFEFSPGEKTISLLDDFLNDFSISQVYGIIYKGITSATRYYQEKSVSKLQAANSVIGACQRYAEKAMLNDWDIKKYSRIIDLPQTVISEFFFNKMLKIGDEGFNSIPRKL